jgi:hypothetical protein
MILLSVSFVIFPRLVMVMMILMAIAGPGIFIFLLLCTLHPEGCARVCQMMNGSALMAVFKDLRMSWLFLSWAQLLVLLSVVQLSKERGTLTIFKPPRNERPGHCLGNREMWSGRITGKHSSMGPTYFYGSDSMQSRWSDKDKIGPREILP